MGLKPLLIIIVLLGLFTGYFILGAESISEKIEAYSAEKLQEPDIEKYARYNIEYMNLVGKYDRALVLIEKFLQKYPEDASNTKLDKIYYLRAKTYDQKIEAGPARDAYKQYLELYPEGKYAQDVKTRLREMMVY